MNVGRGPLIEPKKKSSAGRIPKLVWIGSAVLVGIVVVMIGVSGLVGIVQPKVTARQSLLRMLSLVDDTVRSAGGDWTYGDKTTRWVPRDTTGYTPDVCEDADDGPQQYEVTLYGPGVSDTNGAATKMLRHWQKLGYRVSTVYEDGPDLANDIQIRADTSDGTGLSYAVSNNASQIQGFSTCLPLSAFSKK